MADTFRAMCAELGALLSDIASTHPKLSENGVKVINDLSDRALALMAQPEPEGLSFSDVMEWSSGIEPWATWLAPGGCLENAHFELDQLVTSALARWGHPTPQPPADGEVGELVTWLRAFANGERHEGRPATAQSLARTADLLQRFASPACYVLDPGTGAIAVLEPAERTVLVPAAQPVAVSERPWDRKGWCDELGRCWMGDPGGGEFIPSWRLCRPDDAPNMQVSLPFNALPIPPSDAN